MDEYAQRRLAEKDLGKSFFCQERGRRRAGRGRRRIEEEEEEEEIKKEPEVPPTTKVSSSTQTDLPGEAALAKERYQLPLQALANEKKQRKRKVSTMMIQLLQLRNLQPFYGMVKTSREMKRNQFLENYPNVFPMVAIQPGQVFTTWDFLRSQTTDICFGTRSTDRPINHII